MKLEGQGKLTAGCLFCGMGGFASGLAKAGFKIAWASDSDRYACKTFQHRFPGVRVIQEDIHALTKQSAELESVDILVAGFPCQSFSLAGNRLGFEDPRGKTFFEIPRLIKEFSMELRPKLLLLENVPNLLYGGKLEWFDKVRRELRRAGYWFRSDSCWIVNVKEATELPQDRERLFMVAALRSHFTYNPFALPKEDNAQNNRKSIDKIIDRSQQGTNEAYLSPENRYYKMIERAISEGVSDQNVFQLRRSYVREKRDGLCPTLTANMGEGGHNVPFIKDSWGIRKLSVNEVAQLQGFNSKENIFPEIPEKEQYKLLGNAVCVNLAQRVGEACQEILNGGH